MRNFIIAILLLAPITLFAQKGDFTLEGKVGNLNAPAKIYLSYVVEGKIINDSMPLLNGQFKFKGSVINPTMANIIINRAGLGMRKKPNERIPVYLESGAIQLNSPDSLPKAIITGSKSNVELEEYQLSLKQINQQVLALMAEIKALTEEQKKDSTFFADLIKRGQKIDSIRKKSAYNFIKSHPNSFLSLDLLQPYSMTSAGYAELSSLFNALAEEIKTSFNGKIFTMFLERLKTKENIGKLESGEGEVVVNAVLAFTQNDPNGKPIKLSDFKGKYVLIDFWASWCKPCRAENPNVVKAYAIYHPKGLEILGVSLDNDKVAWIKAIKDDNLGWKHVSDLKGWQNAVGVLYGIQSIPANILIDPKGKIIAKNLRGEALETKLAEILK